MGVYGERSDDLIDLLNKKSGLLGVSGTSSDIRDLIPLLDHDANARLAFDMYVHRLKKYIGGYALILGGMDALIFTDDIGCTTGWSANGCAATWRGAGRAGPEANRAAIGDVTSLLSAAGSRVKSGGADRGGAGDLLEGMRLIEASHAAAD